MTKENKALQVKETNLTREITELRKDKEKLQKIVEKNEKIDEIDEMSDIEIGENTSLKDITNMVLNRKRTVFLYKKNIKIIDDWK